jgi:hypothetical protein
MEKYLRIKTSRWNKKTQLESHRRYFTSISEFNLMARINENDSIDG